MSCLPTNVGVNLYDLLDAGRIHQGRSDALLHCNEHSILSLYANRGGAKLMKMTNNEGKC